MATTNYGFTRPTVGASIDTWGTENESGWTELDAFLLNPEFLGRGGWAIGSNIASAATISIPTDGNRFLVTGTTGISGINTAFVGCEVTLEFQGACVLTHSASLVLPGAANITTVAGDIVKLQETATGVWEVTSWLRNSGVPIASLANDPAPTLSAAINTPEGYGFADANDVAILVAAAAVTTPVNYMEMINAAAAGNPGFNAVGSDTDVGFDFTPKGAGRLQEAGNNVLVNGVTDSLTKGYSATLYDHGTISSGTVTLDEADGPLQKITNNGAFILDPPSNDTSLVVDILNAAAAGAVTTSGFDKVDGAFSTTNTYRYRCYVSVVDSISQLIIHGMQ